MIEPGNPYKAPQAEVADSGADQGRLELASRGRRLAGALIDGLLLVVVLAAIGAVFGFDLTTYNRYIEGVADDAVIMLKINVLCFVVWDLIHGWFLRTRGQTVGKLILGMRIVHPDGSRVGVPRIVGNRYGVPMLIFFITPFLLNAPIAYLIIFLINALWIFGPQRRCLHDLLANTIVIKC